MDKERIRHIFDFLEYDNVSDEQLNLLVSFEEQFIENGSLSEKQYEILEDIFRKTSG